MIKTDLKVKENITFIDKANAITTILEWMFEDNSYEPWYKEPARIWAVCNNFLEGIEFEETDAFLDIYEADDELKSLVDLFLEYHEGYDKYFEIMEFVDDNVERAEEYTCDLMVHSVKNYDLERIVEACNIIIDSLENYSKLNINSLTDEEFSNVMGFFNRMKDVDVTPENISNALKESTGINWDEKANEVIESKNKEIRELREQIELSK